MARRGTGPVFAAFAGVVGMGAYIWMQTNKEEVHHVVENGSEDFHRAVERSKAELHQAVDKGAELAEQSKAKADELIRQAKVAGDHLAHDVKVYTDEGLAAVSDAVHLAKVKTETVFDEVKTGSAEYLQHAKETGEHLLEDVRHKIDEAVDASKPGLLGQLKAKTDGLLHSAHKETEAAAATAQLAAAGSPTGPAMKADVATGSDDHSWAAPVAYVVGHIGFAFWHKGGSS